MSTFSTRVRSDENDTCVIDLIGYLDAHTASEVEGVFETQFAQGCRRFVVNFEELDYISSAGLGVFMEFIEAVKMDSGDIRMAAFKPTVFSVFDILGFPILFKVYDTVDQAVQSYKGSS